MPLLTFPSDVHVAGKITCQTMNVPDQTIVDADVASDAGIQATKLEHDHIVTLNQPNTSATSETRSIYRARKPGSVVEIAAGSIAAAIGAATVTIDLKKGGATILTAVITLDNANSARVQELGTLSAATYAAN